MLRLGTGCHDAALYSAGLSGLDANSDMYLLPLQRHFLCRVSYHGGMREAAGGLYARPRKCSTLAQDHDPTLPGDVALHQALEHQSVIFDSCAAREGVRVCDKKGLRPIRHPE